MLNKKSKLIVGIMSSVLSVLLVVAVVGNILAFTIFDGVLTSYFGVNVSESNYETNQYFERKEQSAQAASEAAAELSYETEAEGAVLLMNNGILPLSKGAKVSCFSQSSVDLIYGSFGGSGEIDASDASTLHAALKKAGINPNPTLENFYKAKTQYRRVTGGLAQGVSKNPYKWYINEVPYSQYTSDVIASYEQYSDAAIIVISRTGCENGDLPRDMSLADANNTGSLLELDQTEREMFENVKNEFENVVVLLNTGNPMECRFLEEYGVDACLWIGGVGQFGIEAVADILVGKENPSGRLVDTYAYDVFSAPAMQNMGNFIYVNPNGTLSPHRYVNYAEGIYVGYRYYETRYEDAILHPTVAGDYNYTSTVQFPFGYGLSYTNFEWSDYSVEIKDGEVIVEVVVKNTGKMAGKDVVEVYFQSPYTAYDRENRLEKSAVELIGFAKTKELAPQESETVSITFSVEEMKSYDAYGKGTYYLEAGSEDTPYYVTAAHDAHSAIDNILKVKGEDVVGDQEFVKKLTEEIQETVYSTDGVTKAKVENLFSDCVAPDGLYLSRSNWTAMEAEGLRYGEVHGKDSDGTTYKYVISEELKSGLEQVGYAAAGAPDEEFTTPTIGKTGVKSDIPLIQLKGKDFNDSAWDQLLDSVTLNEMVRMAKTSGYKTHEMSSINKPYATDADGPSAWNSFIGSGTNSGGFPYAIVIASTWNTELTEKIGDIMGELCLWAKIKNGKTDPNLTGWYAPAMNIHRTPFGGRNFEYYSECGFLSGKIGASIVKGATERGVICYIKHFAFNEQETNRMRDNVVWAEEQCLREIYLKPFEYSIKEGKSLGLMTAYNRIGRTWTGGSYALLTKLVREEWGFNGFIITDYMDGDYENVDQMLAAGGDAALNPVDNQRCTVNTAQAKTYLRRATKHMLYAFVNSNGMNGIDGATRVVLSTPKYHAILIGIDIGVGVALLIGLAVILMQIFPQWKNCFVKTNRKEENNNEENNNKETIL